MELFTRKMSWEMKIQKGVDSISTSEFCANFVHFVLICRCPEKAQDYTDTISDDLPFTQAFKDKIRNDVLKGLESFQEYFEKLFPDGITDEEHFKEVIGEVMQKYVTKTISSEFQPLKFYEFCLNMSHLGAQATMFGVKHASILAVFCIKEAIHELRVKALFRRFSFMDLELFCVGYGDK